MASATRTGPFTVSSARWRPGRGRDDFDPARSTRFDLRGPVARLALRRLALHGEIGGGPVARVQVSTPARRVSRRPRPAPPLWEGYATGQRAERQGGIRGCEPAGTRTNQDLR
jgi:hypothetical protein